MRKAVARGDCERQMRKAVARGSRGKPLRYNAKALLTIVDCEEKHMLLVRAIIRPEKTGTVMSELAAAGFPAVTKMDVYGRGKQKGITVGEVYYDEIPKEMLLVVCNDEDKDDLVKIIIRTAKTGQGNFGDGRIFVSPVESAYTISTGKAGL
jgi:nitrogen regulatory protein PII 1